ncbi:hypothetical protein DFJ77DRAFT_453656 [Powellomyces hirtus]|nr:hypothetical protein DFJ77DRAFT_453656 [Powellomyces hirtus]
MEGLEIILERICQAALMNGNARRIRERRKDIEQNKDYAAKLRHIQPKFLDELRTEDNKLSKELSQLDIDSHNLIGRISRDLSSTIESTINRAVESRVSALKHEISHKYGKEIADLKTEVNRLRSESQHDRTTILQLEGQINSLNKASNTRVEFDARVAACERATNVMENRFTKLQTTMSHLKEEVKATRTDHDLQAAEETRRASEVEKLQKDTDSKLKRHVDSLRQEIETLKVNQNAGQRRRRFSDDLVPLTVGFPEPLHDTHKRKKRTHSPEPLAGILSTAQERELVQRIDELQERIATMEDESAKLRGTSKKFEKCLKATGAAVDQLYIASGKNILFG